jgi:hypothetical protein
MVRQLRSMGWSAAIFLIAASGCNVLIGAEKDYHPVGEGGGDGGTGGVVSTGVVSTGVGGGMTSEGCPSPWALCDGICTDTQVDPNHCGVCGAACEAGQVCSDGMCGCSSGLDWCDMSGCVILDIDPENCGECGNSCGMSACVMGICDTGLCSLGQPCLTDQDCCQLHECGMNQCVCASGLTECGMADCTDLAFDPYNCGACGNECPPGELCLMGMCQGG